MRKRDAWRIGVIGMLLIAFTGQGAGLVQGLVSYWPLDTITVDSTPDLISGNRLFVYKLNKSHLVEGRFGKALSLDGKSQFLALNYPNNPQLPLYNAGDFTITIWVKAPSGQDNKVLFAEGYTLDDIPLFRLGTPSLDNGNSLNAFLRTPTEVQLEGVLGEKVIFDDTWHHVAWVNQDGLARLYVDGALDVTTYTYEHKSLRLNYLSIGSLLSDEKNCFLAGLVDEVAIWNRALTKAEVQQVMNGQLIADCASIKRRD